MPAFKLTIILDQDPVLTGEQVSLLLVRAAADLEGAYESIVVYPGAQIVDHNGVVQGFWEVETDAF